MTITDQTTVAELAASIPSSVRIFQQHGIDFCCGGKAPLKTACDNAGVPFDVVVRAIEEAAAGPAADDRDWTREPLHDLVDHIVSTYHRALRLELPRLTEMSAKVARVHGAKADYLARIGEIVPELAGELLSHMNKEEQVLFPAIGAVERGLAVRGLSGPVSVMEHEHESVGAMLGELRKITGGFTPPEWGCATVRALYHGLDELETTMHVHVHLENNVLFPRALALASPAVRM